MFYKQIVNKKHLKNKNIMNNMDKIIIKDKKIIEFYNKYKNIDIEKVNLKIIELYEEIIKTLSGEMKDHVTSEILTKIKMQEKELESLKNELKTEMTSIKE